MAKRDVKKIIEKDHKEFAEAVAGLSVKDLEARLLSYAKEQENVAEHLENNEIINTLKEQLKEAKAPYSDAKKAISLKSRYLIALIKEKGGDGGGGGEHAAE
jgi:hypothetical protein